MQNSAQFAMPSPEEFQQMLALLNKFPAMFPGMDARARVLVSEIVDKYLENAPDEVSQRRYEYITLFLGRFRKAMGHKQVGELAPLDLKTWMTEQASKMKSDWTKANVKSMVMRAFNWAVECRLIRENPFRGFKLKGLEKIPGREIRPEEFQAVLRHTDMPFRQFLIALKLTGARPSELARLKWSDIDWDRGLAILTKHKTVKKTGKPRVIVLIPQVLKLLSLIKRDQHGPSCAELKRILTHAPDQSLLAGEVRRQMKQMGFTTRATYRARERLGVVFRRLGQGKGTLYVLPPEASPRPLAFGDYCFLSTKYRPWTRTAWSQKFRRLKHLINLPLDCKLYGTRHLFCTWAVKRGVNLKAVATLMGHTTTTMVEKNYCHVDGDYEFLQDAARAATALAGQTSTLPTPADPAKWQQFMAEKYPRSEPTRRKRLKARPPASPLQACECIVWKAYQWALKECPELATKTEFDVFDFLISRREFAGQLPPAAETFRRYINRARHHYHGAGKRKLRRLDFQSPQETAPCPASNPSPVPPSDTSSATPRPPMSAGNG